MDGRLFTTYHFSVKFKDTYYNEYEQDYMFQYSVALGIGRIESYLPRLVKKNMEINMAKSKSS